MTVTTLKPLLNIKKKIKIYSKNNRFDNNN